MAHCKNTYRYPNAIEVEEFHTGKYGAPGQSRQKKQKATPEQIERINQYNREKLARRKLRMHFQVHDYFTCLTYQKSDRPPDMAAAKEHFKQFMRLVRKEYRKRGYEVKWMRNIEVGTKNGWHIHLIINRIPDTDIILATAWTRGTAVSKLLYEKGEFAQLAAYITKTPKTDSKQRETSYSTSRNLPIPPPEKKIIYGWKLSDKIRVPKGYYLDKQSLREGINPVTGYGYRTYTMLKLRPDKRRTG